MRLSLGKESLGNCETQYLKITTPLKQNHGVGLALSRESLKAGLWGKLQVGTREWSVKWAAARSPCKKGGSGNLGKGGEPLGPCDVCSGPETCPRTGVRW